MAEPGGLRYKMLVMQWGPIPPSGGPNRERYLDHHGRRSLQIAADEYEEALRLLGPDATMPALDFDLVEQDEDARRAIQRQKRAEWLQFESTIDQVTLNAIEPHIKRSVSAAMDALNYLEDHQLREKAHAAIHRAAFVKRGLFGCPITFGEDEEYWTDCPINISHLRMGVSAGLVSDFECSICGKLVEDCDHAMGEYYPKVASRDPQGRCTICAETECDHPIGETIAVPAWANARNVKATEVSMVARPRYPLARMVEKSYDLGPAGDDPRVRNAAKQGVLNCDGDLGPCKGFNEMTEWDVNGVSEPEGDVEQQIDLLREL
ncbi:hypothetical protein [Microbacterium jiangjiandongii]|uniref:hypothetical protein n=1 Tax=Microbacterium jiangjiandongii TaxID=3049071 RepID=UPI00214CA5AF|nr:hypothetical protein [Microbacterium sp. zg.Y843]MCR2816488.1 hypothetical protein [Microbacterium sp. zg.Y843]